MPARMKGVCNMASFNYKEFKNEMLLRGHKVHKKGPYITIEPNNGATGFLLVTDIINPYEDDLRLIKYEHYNTLVYSAEFKIKD